MLRLQRSFIQLSVSPGGPPKRPVAGSFLTLIGFRGDPPLPAGLALLIACELTRPGEADSYYASVVMTGWVRVNDNIELIDAAA